MGGGVNPSPSKFSYSDIFDENFPYYLAMGMSYAEYWNMDCLLVKAYRKKAQIELEMKNQQAWLQGMYIYEAMMDVAPFVKFSTKPVKPTPYRTEPYDLSGKNKEEEPKNNDKAFAYMHSFMVEHNKKYAEVDNGKCRNL